MHHPSAEIAKWLAMFPLDDHIAKLKAQKAPDFWYNPPDDICSPRDLALTEQIRARAGVSAAGGGVAVDVLLPALGEPPRRAVSKIGGLPYRPRGAWPQGSRGRPLSFLGQICLADSRDVLTVDRQALPGDVLLIFLDEQDDGLDLIWSENEGARLHFEWQMLGIGDDQLVRPEEVPEQAVQWRPVYFERFRSREYEGEWPLMRLGNAQIEAPFRYAASKIGGLPVWWQDESEADGLGAFFACLHSINPVEEVWPLANVEKSPWGGSPYDEGFLMLGDVGTLYLFAKGNGRVGWLMQCG
jgi:hypothetical protein